MAAAYDETDLTEATKIISYFRSIRIYAVAIACLSLLYLGFKIYADAKDMELNLLAGAAGVLILGSLPIMVRLNYRTAILYGISSIFRAQFSFDVARKHGETCFGFDGATVVYPASPIRMPMPAATVACATSRTATYRRRQPERTVLYRTVQTHLATWLELAQDESGRSAPAHVEREFRRYLECGILAHGFARVRCADCGHDFLIAFSCKGRGVCPSCNTRRMVETAAHLADHVLPRLPVRQWVLSVPKRLRYFLQTDPAVQNLALHIFLSAVEQGLRTACPAAGSKARIGAVAFIHRFGALLNPHVHFHCVVVDGVFEAGTEVCESVRFHEAPALNSEQQADIQRNIRRRLLRALTRRGLLETDAARTRKTWL